jgi:hypothetical protein
LPWPYCIKIKQTTNRHFKTKEANKSDITRFLKKIQGYINFVGQVRGEKDAVYLRQRGDFDRLILIPNLEYFR